MNEIETMLSGVKPPEFYRVKYNFPSDTVTNISEAVTEALARKGTLDRILPGQTVAITGGSREISGITIILGTFIKELLKIGAKPFIFPAMGSHGGATAQGQREVLASYGITQKTMGVPIHSSMETVKVGETPQGLPVHADKYALGADHIIPIGRIKPHTDFKGRYESGLMKMLAIGLGKQHGANLCHKMGMPKMSENVLAFGKELLDACRIPFGIGIIENAFHQTHRIVAVPGECFEEEEPDLLLQAKSLIPAIPFDKVDVIMCQQMGKEISGTGMDSNVIGRSASLGISKPYAERIGILDLTEKTHGNFNGVGLGDAISQRLFSKMSFETTYPNTITALEPNAVKIPPVMPTDRLCFAFCLSTCTQAENGNLRVVWIKDTLSMDSFFISEALLAAADNDPLLAVEDGVFLPGFDREGTFQGFQQAVM